MDRATAKIILNSMYGRLGMKPYFDNIEIVESSKAEEIVLKFVVKEQYNLTDKLEFLRYENTPISEFQALYGADEYLNFILLDLGIEIYYMDTDSMTIERVLPEELVGNILEQFKLEHKIDHAYFISPKLYALKTLNGENIVKAKGIGSRLEFNQFESLIYN
ncbi:hypothetical protein EI94DRAFT_1575340 [Lactarius quietus]|nr:hypothetical protein EI94DRAFT_1575340 [Lactarius quietus]